jgi:DNA mismatch repair protein MutS
MEDKLSPMLKQYHEVKNKYKDYLVLFRLGDFYEAFFEDAKVLAEKLQITFTSRPVSKEERIPMAGIPHHALHSYLAKLLKGGAKVVLCDQVEEAKPGKLVKREVTRVFTPGTLIEDELIPPFENNYILAINLKDKKEEAKLEVGIAYSDVSTGDFYITQLNSLSKLNYELLRLSPKECLLVSDEGRIKDLLLFPCQTTFTTLPKDTFSYSSDPYSELVSYFDIVSLESFGIPQDWGLAISAALALINYINSTLQENAPRFHIIKPYRTEDYMILDPPTLINLDLDEKEPNLYSILDKTKTAPGSRLLRRILRQPLLSIDSIKERQRGVMVFYNSHAWRDKLRSLLAKLPDLERMVGRIKSRLIKEKEGVILKASLRTILNIKEVLKNLPDNSDILKYIDSIREEEINDLREFLKEAMIEEPFYYYGEASWINPEYNQELKYIKKLVDDTQSVLLELEERERAQTKIQSLKVGYNKVFGYYIEVSKSNLSLVPNYYIRKQTLTNAERYITAELKELELTLLNAQNKIKELLKNIWEEIKEKLLNYTDLLTDVVSNLAYLDLISTFAEVGVKRNWSFPLVKESGSLKIISGRHPIVEKVLEDKRIPFVPNDTELKEEEMLIITGPNMGGKSTYIRQVAHIVLLAQCGSLVPAEYAEIPLFERIFTRIGAHDKLYSGLSTFMVEMIEVANILNSATPRSLIILDELGRGTSTYDGISIAYASCEYILKNIKARTLFATHYHELTSLEEEFPDKVTNYNVAVKKEGKRLVFLYKVEVGATNRSYGISVGQLAGLPKEVIIRSKEILTLLQKYHSYSGSFRQIPLFPSSDLAEEKDLLSPPEREILEELSGINLEELTPLAAFQTLWEWQRRLNAYRVQ